MGRLYGGEGGMKLKLPLVALKPLQGKGYPGLDDLLRWNRDGDLADLDIEDYDPEQLDGIIKSVEAQKDAIEALHNGPRVKVIVANLRVWIEALKNPGEAKPRRLQQVPGLLKKLLIEKALSDSQGMPRYWLYKKESATDEKSQPYFITNAKFVPRDERSDSPPYATMTGDCYVNGRPNSETWTWHTGDIRGRTLIQMLMDKQLFFETPEMLAAYEADIELMKDIRPRHGQQYVATGQANLDTSGDSYARGQGTVVVLDRDGLPTRLVVHDKLGSFEAPVVKTMMWEHVRFTDEGDIVELGAEVDLPEGEERKGFRNGRTVISKRDGSTFDAIYHWPLPIHATVRFFDLERHRDCWVHVRNVTPYVYNENLDTQLVLPQEQKDLLHVLMEDERIRFEDIVKGKSGGRIILCYGPPGTGKTLTAECFSETVKRPLMAVQSAHLGVTPKEVQENLKWYLNIASELGLLMLFDEADVFIHKRGQDLQQNAIVGMVLQVLEYFRGILFMTTNRKEVVDDAVLSRCVASIGYGIPSESDQARIWMNLSAASKFPMDEAEAKEIARRHPNFSGRDVKNLLKLAMTVNARTGKPITADVIDWVHRFKPTADIKKE